MACPACIKRGKTWKGDDPVCAFETTRFEDNYQCATLNKIREVCELEHESIHLTRTESQQWYATINLDQINEIEREVCLYVGWYKSRGRTETMWMISYTEPPRRPTLDELEIIIKYFQNNK